MDRNCGKRTHKQSCQMLFYTKWALFHLPLPGDAYRRERWARHLAKVCVCYPSSGKPKPEEPIPEPVLAVVAPKKVVKRRKKRKRVRVVKPALA